MSELGELMHSTRNENTVHGTIEDINIFGSFHMGSISLDLNYETIEVQLTIDTEFETVHLTTNINNFFESPLSDLLLEKVENESEDSFNLEELIGMNVYIAFSENFNRASIGTDIDVKYNSEDNLVQKQMESVDTVEERDIEYANKKVQNDFYRKSEGVDGWIKAELSYIGEVNDKYVFEGALETGTTLYWTFDTTIESVSQIKNFLNNLGITYTTKELGTENVWVKPISQVDHTNVGDSKLMLDSEQKWTVRKEPQTPGYSFLERVFNRLTSSDSISASFETGKSKTIANASDTENSFKDSLETEEVTSDLTLEETFN